MSQLKIERHKATEVLRTPTVRDVGISILLFLSGRASVLGLFPFGVAFFAACFDKSIAYLGITLLSISIMTSAGGAMLAKYLVASLMYWIYTRFTERDNMVLDAVSVACSVMVGGFVFLIYTYAGFYDILMLLTESMVASLMFIIFKKSQDLIKNRKKRTQTAQDELISVFISIGIMITGLSGSVLPYDISISDIVSVYAVLCVALHGGISVAGSGGLCIGFLSAMSSPNAVVSMGAFGISALFGNLLKSFGRCGVALGFFGGSAVALLYAGDTYALPVTIIETAIGTVLFVLTPNKIQGYIKSFFGSSLKLEAVSADVRVKEYLSMRLQKSSRVLQSLEESFENASEKRLKAYQKDVAVLFDDVAERVCEGCPNVVKCWQSDFTRTYRSIMLLLDTIETQGLLDLESVPLTFRDKCLRTELFVLEFNHVYELYKKNLVRTSEAVTSRNLVARQYREMALLMEGMAEDIRSGFSFREEIEEMLVAELDKVGIMAYEVSVIESGGGKIEVYLGTARGVELGKIEGVLEQVLETPMAFECDSVNGLMKFTSRAKFSADVSIKQVCRDYSEASGDSVEAFVTEDYKQYVILSDGMGSGKRAMNESRITLKLLKEFLQAGFGIKNSIEMINSALCLKLDYECFSTVDLLCVDLMTGICEFYKIGASESVLLHSGNVETVFSVSLPVGMLSDIKTQGQTKRLDDGDVVLMMSDGISEAGFGTVRTDWLKKEIKMPFDTMDEMSQAVIETAIKKSRDAVVDDMSVVAVRLMKN